MNEQQTTRTQQHLIFLNAIEELASISSNNKSEIKRIHSRFEHIISKFIEQKSQSDLKTRRLYEKISFYGIDACSDEEFEYLRQLMFTALIIEEGKLFRSKEEQSSSHVDFFEESLKAVEEEKEKSKKKRKEKNKEFIEKLVRQYAVALRLSVEEQKILEKALLKKQSSLEKSYGTSIPPESIYIQEVQRVIQELKPHVALTPIIHDDQSVKSLYQSSIKLYQQRTNFDDQQHGDIYDPASYQQSLEKLGNEIIATLASSNKISQEKIQQLQSSARQIPIQKNGAILSPDEYIEQVASLLSQEQLAKPEEGKFKSFLNDLYQQSQDVQLIRREAERFHREEETYKRLEQEIIHQAKDLAIRNDLREIYPPFVALEAATYALLKTSPPNIPPEEIVENAIALGGSFATYALKEYPETSENIAYLVQESIGARYGDIAKKQSIEILDQIVGPFSSISEESKKTLLYEFIRSDIQGDLLRIIEDKHLLKEIFTNGDNGMTVEAFERFLESPLFAFIEQTVKRQAGQKQGGGIGSLLELVSSSKQLIETTPKTNIALSFILNTQNLTEIQKNESLYTRFVKTFSTLSKDIITLKTPRDAFFSLFIATINHREKNLFFEKIKDVISFKEQKYFYDISFLRFPIKDSKEQPSYQLIFLLRSYITHISRFGEQKFIPFLIHLKAGSSSLPFSLRKIAIKKTGGVILKKIGASVVGGPVGTTLTIVSTALNILKAPLLFIFQDVPIIGNAIKNLSIEKIILYLVLFLFIPLYLLFFSRQNPIIIQSQIMPGFIERYALKDPSVFVESIDCEKDPTNPVCSICYDEQGKRDPQKCLWPVESGCITQGPNPGHKTERGGQGIDISARAGTPVRAMFPGEVIETRWFFRDNQKTMNPNYGNMVRIRTLTNPPFIVVYAHLRQTPHIAKPGDIIGPDTIIGFVDNTGYGTGTHLHMEIQGVPAGNILPFNVPPCINKVDCERKMAQMGYSNCW